MPTTQNPSNPATRSGRVTKDRLSQRKRAPIACQFCRLRKTRCDGVKPICGFCKHHEAQCVWGPSLDHDEGTPVEQIILQRLEEIQSLLRDSRVPVAVVGEHFHSSQLTATPTLERPASPVDTTASQMTVSDPSSSAHSSFARTRCETLLAWPIYRSLIQPDVLAIESFVVECDGSDLEEGVETSRASDSAVRTRRVGLGIPEEIVVSLCQKFLVHVHARNPILQTDKFIEYARHVAEHGPQWDNSSCLVLLACALACYTTPFSTHDDYDAREDPEDSALAQTFYLAAKKRFGLLGWSLIDIQCLFFASIYEKYLLKPLHAWFHIQQASTRLQAHLRRVKNTSPRGGDNGFSGSDQQLQRLFWSLYRAEHELLLELPFTSSGLEMFTRADSMFPVLPTFTPASNETTPLERYNEERSWAFYSAEISIRRTITDTILTLYRKGEDYWFTHGASLIRQCQACEREIWTWYAHLPPSIRFDYAEEPDNELSFYLQGRFNQWRTFVSIPILYYVLHRTESQILTQEIISFVRESVAVCANNIVRADRHNRHGGTWMCCRGTFSNALLILGVVLKADANLVPPPNWTDLVSLSISTLRKWETEAADILKLRVTLERLLSAVQYDVQFSNRVYGAKS